jgi:hypothetical protein
LYQTAGPNRTAFCFMGANDFFFWINR